MNIMLNDESALCRFAEDLALCLKKGDMLTLSGALGAGKSALARALIRALADDDGLEVPSPTFTLMQIYEETRIPLAHADIYRIAAAEELEELGLEEFRQNGIVLVEWPERASDLAERAQFRLHLREEADERRLLEISAAAEAGARLRHSLSIRAFLQENGRGAAKRRYLQGDASPRAYEKLYLPPSGGKSGKGGSDTEILMDAPAAAIHDKARAAYMKRAHLAAHNRQFAACAGLLRAQGFKAPALYAENSSETLLILEDLGNEGIADKHGRPLCPRFIAAAQFLAQFHQTDWPKAAKEQACPLPLYDSGALQAEADLFSAWYVPYKTGKPAAAAWEKRWQSLWAELFAALRGAEQSLVLRDFHSPNILWQEHEKGVRRIGLIDFQDAVLGAAAYDLVSLAQDARLDIDAKLEDTVKTAYFTARAAFPAPFDAKQCEKAYAIAGAQRACKILGVFVRLSKQDGKSGYMRHLPRIAEYLKRNLAQPPLAELKRFFAESGLLP